MRARNHGHLLRDGGGHVSNETHRKKQKPSSAQRLEERFTLVWGGTKFNEVG